MMDDPKKQDAACPGTAKMQTLAEWLKAIGGTAFHFTPIVTSSGTPYVPPATNEQFVKHLLAEVPIAAAVAARPLVDCQCSQCQMDRSFQVRGAPLVLEIPATELLDLDFAIERVDWFLRQRCNDRHLSQTDYNALAEASNKLNYLVRLAMKMAIATRAAGGMKAEGGGRKDE